MKTQITAAERLQLIGLLALADRHDRAMDDIHRSAAELLGIQPSHEGDYHGDLSDAVYTDDRRDADALLARLGIAVGHHRQPGDFAGRGVDDNRKADGHEP